MIVLDTSTLVLLAKSDLLPLLSENTRLMIPREVEQEALAKPELYDAQVIAQMIQMKTLQVSRETATLLCRQIQDDFGLGVGEAAALLLAKKTHAPLATDDWLAIKAAKIMGIPFLTALHVLVALRKKGRIEKKSAIVKLETLQRIGRYHTQIIVDARENINQ